MEATGAHYPPSRLSVSVHEEFDEKVPESMQVEMLRSQLQNVQMDQDAGEQKLSKSVSSQHAARELIADITSTLNVRSSRILRSSVATSPRPAQVGSTNLNAPYANGGVAEVSARS